MKRLAAFWVVVLAAASVPGFSYFPFARVRSTAQGQLIPFKFDLDSLPGGYIPYLVSDVRPASLADRESYTALVSQVQAAAEAWDRVETSALRIRFAGLASSETVQTGPRIEVSFDETPPGVLAEGGPVVVDTIRTAKDGSEYVPIVRSVVRVSAAIVNTRGGFSERLFGTLVHEFGHALGLQHSFASGAMSTEITRAVTKGQPVFADDAAGVSFLYPNGRFSQETGSISGRLTLDRAPVNLGSVVALTPNGPAYNVLTAPDGTYRLDGLRPGQYLIFAHPVPPPEETEVTPGGLIVPIDERDRPYLPTAYFSGRFYPNTSDPRQAATVTVTAGQVTAGIDFQVSRRSMPAVFGVGSYNFPGRDQFQKPGFVLPDNPRSANLYVYGHGVVEGSGASTRIPAGLEVNAIGGTVNVEQMQILGGWLFLNFWFSPLNSEGPRHLYFRRDGDVYLLPAAFDIVRQGAPDLLSVDVRPTSTGEVLELSGANLSPDTKLLFDGLAGTNLGTDPGTGRVRVLPPAGNPAERSRLVAVNPDRQSSLFWDRAPREITYEFPQGPLPAARADRNGLPAGVQSLVEIRGDNTSFRSGDVKVGFGSADVLVTHSWVLDDRTVWANVIVAANAQPSPVSLTVQTGLQLSTDRLAFSSYPPDQQVIHLDPNPRSAAGEPSKAYIGRPIRLRIRGLPNSATNLNSTLRVNGQPVPILGLDRESVLFVIPSTLRPGPFAVRLTASEVEGLPIAVAAEYPPPTLIRVQTEGGASIESGSRLKFGTPMVAVLAGLGDPERTLRNTDVKIQLGPVEFVSSTVEKAEGGYSVRFSIPGSLPVDRDLDLRIGAEGRFSDPLVVRLEP